MDPKPDSNLPTQIGRYQIRTLIGRGGMGEVYGAYDPSLDRLVALKTIVAGADNPSYAERLQREARACGKLHHPGIVTIHDLGESQGTIFIAMEWLQGQTLADAMDAGALTFGDKLRLLIEILDALAFAHAEGIIHRDIKPSNVWVQPNGRAKLLDFGLARLQHLDALTLPGEVMGTPYYMSPEQLKGQTVDGRTDVFSTGVLGYELLAHRRAFDGESITAIIIKVLGETPPPIGTAWTAAFPQVDEIIAKAIAKSPDDRFASAGDFATALRQFVDAHRDAIPRIEAEVTRESSQAVREAEALLATGRREEATALLATALVRDPDAATVRAMLSGPTVVLSPPPAPARGTASPAMTPPNIIRVPRGGTTTVRAPVAGRPAEPVRSPAPAPAPLMSAGTTPAPEPWAQPRASSSSSSSRWVWTVAACVIAVVGIGGYVTFQSAARPAGSADTNASASAPPAPIATVATAPPPSPTPTATPAPPVASAPSPVASAPSPVASASAPPSPSPTSTGGGQATATPDAQGRRGRPGGPPVNLSGIGISDQSVPVLRNLVANKLVNDLGIARGVPGQTRFILTLTGELSVNKAVVGTTMLTASYAGEAQVLDRVTRRTDSKEFAGQVADVGEPNVRQKANRELADKMAEFIAALIRSR